MNIIKLLFYFLLFFCLTVSFSFADSVTLKNGEVLNGKVNSPIPNSLLFNSSSDKNNSIGIKATLPATIALQTSYGLIQVQTNKIKHILKGDNDFIKSNSTTNSFWHKINPEFAFLLGSIFPIGSEELNSNLSSFPAFYFQGMGTLAATRKYHLHYAVQIGFQKFSFSHKTKVNSVEYSAIYNIPLLAYVYYLHPFSIKKIKFRAGMGLGMGYALSMLSASTGMALGPNPIIEVSPALRYLFSSKIKFALDLPYQHIFDRHSSLYGLGFRFSVYYKL